MQNKNSARPSSYRWIIVALLFFATLINYYNRIVLSVVIPYVKQDLGVTDIEYSYILSFFQFGYMFGSLLAGKVIDRLGTKLGYWLSIFFWSVFAALHSTVRSAVALSGWRGMLGLAEAGNFPAAIKSVSEWFPPRERAFATSLFNSGPHIAMVTGAPLIAVITLSLGWRWAFLFMGLSGIVLSALWPFLYRSRDSFPAAAQTPGSAEKPVPWRELLRNRSAWGLMIARFISDPVWWFYIYWLPDYLNTQRDLNIREIGFAVPVIYMIAILMGNAFGWFSGRLIKNGWNETRARKTLMVVCAACMPFTAFAAAVNSLWMVIMLVGLACGAHTGWSANMFALITDQFPSRAVGSVTGISTFTAGVGGLILSAVTVGYMVTYFGYLPVFILMGTLHPVAVLFIYFMVKKT